MPPAACANQGMSSETAISKGTCSDPFDVDSFLEWRPVSVEAFYSMGSLVNSSEPFLMWSKQKQVSFWQMGRRQVQKWRCRVEKFSTSFAENFCPVSFLSPAAAIVAVFVAAFAWRLIRLECSCGSQKHVISWFVDGHFCLLFFNYYYFFTKEDAVSAPFHRRVNFVTC